MVEPEWSQLRRAPGVLLLALTVTTACASVDKVKPAQPPAGTSPSGVELVIEEPQEASPEAPEPALSEETVDVVEPEVEDAIQSPEPEADDGTAPNDKSLVVIDTGARNLTERPRSLAEAAQVERERRGLSPPAEIVITDQNLSEYATGDLTIADTSNEAAAAISAELSELEREMAEKEAFWRGGVLKIREEWRAAYDRIEELEAKVFDLRQQFYREDDGFYRDAEIKPAWDRAIDQLEEARLEVEAKQEELAVFLEEGREAGALPGWLREGIDLEPKPTASRDPIAKPAEPVIYEPEASDPP